METKYVAAVDLNGYYVVVVASEGIKPCIGHDWLEGIDPVGSQWTDGRWGERLAVLEGTPEGSVILIKGRPDGRLTEIYRLFQVKEGAIIELEVRTNIRGGWSLNQFNGHLVYISAPGSEVSPEYWGYCLIIEKGWAWGEYEDALRQEARPEPGTVGALNQLIRERQRANKAENIILQIAGIVLGKDLLAKIEGGHLTDLFAFPGMKHFAGFIADQLHDVFELLQSVIPSLQLPKPHVAGIRHK